MYELMHNIKAQNNVYKQDTIDKVEIMMDKSGSNPYPIMILFYSLELENIIYIPMDLEMFEFIFNRALLNNMINVIDSKFEFDTLSDIDYFKEIGCNYINDKFKGVITRSIINISQSEDGAIIESECYYGFTNNPKEDVSFENPKYFKITLTRFEILQLIKFKMSIC